MAEERYSQEEQELITKLLNVETPEFERCKLLMEYIAEHPGDKVTDLVVTLDMAAKHSELIKLRAYHDLAVRFAHAVML